MPDPATIAAPATAINHNAKVNQFREPAIQARRQLHP